MCDSETRAKFPRGQWTHERWTWSVSFSSAPAPGVDCVCRGLGWVEGRASERAGLVSLPFFKDTAAPSASPAQGSRAPRGWRGTVLPWSVPRLGRRWLPSASLCQRRVRASRSCGLDLRPRAPLLPLLLPPFQPPVRPRSRWSAGLSINKIASFPGSEPPGSSSSWSEVQRPPAELATMCDRPDGLCFSFVPLHAPEQPQTMGRPAGRAGFQ